LWYAILKPYALAGVKKEGEGDAILNLQNSDFSTLNSSWKQITHQHSKFHRIM